LTNPVIENILLQFELFIFLKNSRGINLSTLSDDESASSSIFGKERNSTFYISVDKITRHKSKLSFHSNSYFQRIPLQ
jgi:hypothetical protein